MPEAVLASSPSATPNLAAVSGRTMSGLLPLISKSQGLFRVRAWVWGLGQSCSSTSGLGEDP